MKSPCLECDHHLAGLSKSDQRCMECNLRIEYVEAIGSRASSMEPNSLHGNGGKDPKIIETQMTTDEKIKSLIELICVENKIDLEKLKNYHHAQEVKLAREQIIQKLIDDFNLPNKEIAHYIGISSSSIWKRRKRMEKKSKTKKELIDGLKNDETKKTINPPIADPKSTNSILMLKINFEDHEDIYKSLLQVAIDKLRSPEMQVLYILKQIYEKGMKIQSIEDG